MDYGKQKVKYFPTLPKHPQYMYFSKTENMGYKKNEMYKINVYMSCSWVMLKSQWTKN